MMFGNSTIISTDVETYLGTPMNYDKALRDLINAGTLLAETAEVEISSYKTSFCKTCQKENEHLPQMKLDLIANWKKALKTFKHYAR